MYVSKIGQFFTGVRRRIIEAIAVQTGSLGVQIAGISGMVEDLSQRLTEQSRAMEQVSEETDIINERNLTALKAAREAAQMIQEAEESAAEAANQIQDILGDVFSLTRDVQHMSDELSELERSVAAVLAISDEVDQISRKTNLLAINAAIEAKRAGVHGRSFMTVADAVKALSDRTSDATREISASLDALSEKIVGLRVKTNRTMNAASDVHKQTDGVEGMIIDVPSTFMRVSRKQNIITEATEQIFEATGTLRGEVHGLDDGLQVTSRYLAEASERLITLTLSSEALIEATTRMGVDTIDTPLIRLVQATARNIGKRFERAISKGEVTMGQLFDRHYREIPDTEPRQYMTQFTLFTDHSLQDLLEEVLQKSKTGIFCAAVNLDGYLPTHNLKFSQAQRVGDRDWNAANSRNRRLFNDRVGLAAGQNTRPFLVQAYRRDMGYGQFALMKDISAPIIVNGRHWGGFRLGCRADTDDTNHQLAQSDE